MRGNGPSNDCRVSPWSQPSKGSTYADRRVESPTSEKGECQGEPGLDTARTEPDRLEEGCTASGERSVRELENPEKQIEIGQRAPVLGESFMMAPQDHLQRLGPGRSVAGNASGRAVGPDKRFIDQAELAIG